MYFHIVDESENEGYPQRQQNNDARNADDHSTRRLQNNHAHYNSPSHANRYYVHQSPTSLNLSLNVRNNRDRNCRSSGGYYRRLSPNSVELSLSLNPDSIYSSNHGSSSRDMIDIPIMTRGSQNQGGYMSNISISHLEPTDSERDAVATNQTHELPPPSYDVACKMLQY